MLLLNFCKFCQFQPGVAHESITYKKNCVFLFVVKSSVSLKKWCKPFSTLFFAYQNKRDYGNAKNIHAYETVISKVFPHDFLRS